MISSQKKAWRSGGFFEPVEVLECCGNFMKLQHYAAIFGFTNPSYFVKTRAFLAFYTAEDGEHLPLDLQVAKRAFRPKTRCL